jgi:arginyl-tRNA synthetase
VSGGAAELDVKLCQLVRLMRGHGEPVKMSKRSGEFVTLREVVDEVGRDAVRFMMLYRKNDAPLDFDFAKVVEQSKDNPVFYVQYAHARQPRVDDGPACAGPGDGVGACGRARGSRGRAGRGNAMIVRPAVPQTAARRRDQAKEDQNVRQPQRQRRSGR